MGIINGTFDTDLSGWQYNTKVSWDNGYARFNECGPVRASMSQRFFIDNPILSFDWGTANNLCCAPFCGSYPAFVLELIVHTYDDYGNPISTTAISETFPASGGGTKIKDVSPYIGKEATLQFRDAESGFCCGSNQGWYNMTIDNVNVSPNWGVFDISSVPDGAEIWLDGNNTGYLTPKVIPEITLGDHTVTLKKAGYYDYPTTIRNVLPGRTYAISATLILKVGNLVLATYPAGAKIFLSEKDGTVLNDTGFVTPRTLTNLPWGTYKWKVHLDFYKDESGTAIINIPTGAIVSRTLIPGGNISFVTSPTGASITIDGILQEGITTPAVIGVEDGSHTYILSISGYQNIEGAIYVYLAQTSEVIKILLPLCTPNWQCESGQTGYETDGCGNRRENPACLAKGSIKFTSTPAGAEIFLDGAYQGIKTPATLIDVPIGLHGYTLKLDGFNDSTGTVQVLENQIAEVSTSLTPGEGCIYFITSVPGAKIFVDDADTWQVTPALICGLSLGPHTYRLSLTGYQDITGNFNLAVGQGTTVTDTLPKEGIETGTIAGIALLGACALGVIIFASRKRR